MAHQIGNSLRALARTLAAYAPVAALIGLSLPAADCQIPAGQSASGIGDPRAWTTAYAFAPDNDVVAVSTSDGPIRTWSGKTGLNKFLPAALGAANVMAYSGDSRFLAAADVYGNVHIWDSSSGVVVSSHHITRNLVQGIALSPHGELLAACGGTPDRTDGFAGVWRVGSGKALWTHRARQPDNTAIAFAPDGGHIAVAIGRRTIVLDALTGHVVAAMAPSKTRLHCLSFSADGRLLAGGDDLGVYVWLVKTGRAIDWFACKADVHAVALPENGRFLLSGGSDGIIHVRDVSHGTELLRLWTTGTPVVSLSVPQGEAVVRAGCMDAAVRTWNWKTGSFVGGAFVPPYATPWTEGGSLRTEAGSALTPPHATP